MQKKTGFIAYDWVKLIVAILLVLAIFLLWQAPSQSAAPTAVETEEVVDVEPSPTAEPVVAETEEAAEEDETTADTPAEVELPSFPEASADLEYDAAQGGLVDADGNLVYLLNEDGSGWTPFIPADKADLTLDGEWELLDADGNPAYTWDAETNGWVAVPQEDPAEEEQAATTNIVDCPGAADARLEGGQQAEALRDVNLRSSPGVGDNWIGSLFAGDQVKVMGETDCTPHGNGAYLWWQIERPDGKTGWVAEAKANSPSYFLASVE